MGSSQAVEWEPSWSFSPSLKGETCWAFMSGPCLLVEFFIWRIYKIVFPPFIPASLLLVLLQHSAVPCGGNWPYIPGSSGFQSILPAQSSWVRASQSRHLGLGQGQASAHVQNHKCPEERKRPAANSRPRKGSSFSAILAHLTRISTALWCLQNLWFCSLLSFTIVAGREGRVGVACHDLSHLTWKQDFSLLFAIQQMKRDYFSCKQWYRFRFTRTFVTYLLSPPSWISDLLPGLIFLLTKLHLLNFFWRRSVGGKLFIISVQRNVCSLLSFLKYDFSGCTLASSQSFPIDIQTAVAEHSSFHCYWWEDSWEPNHCSFADDLSFP